MDTDEKRFLYKAKTEPYMINVLACAIGLVIFGGIAILDASGTFDLAEIVGMDPKLLTLILRATGAVFGALALISAAVYFVAVSRKPEIILTTTDITIPLGNSGSTTVTRPLVEIAKIYIEPIDLDKVMILRRRKDEDRILQSRMVNDLAFSNLSKFLQERHEAALGGGGEFGVN